MDTLAHELGLCERLGSQGEKLLAAGVPAAWMEQWVRARRVRAMQNLLLAREEGDLLKVLHERGIQAIPLKGVSLAQMLHEDLSVRSVTDMDLGIRLGQMVCAAGILEQRGYTIRLLRELLSHATFLRSAGEHGAEAVCVREQGGFSLMVELHWKVLPLPEDLIWSSLVEYGDSAATGPPVRTLAPDLYLLYLCAHVSGHGWTSLRWLCDVADFLLRFAQRIDAAQFLRSCSLARLRHRVGSTLELVEAYFGLRWEPGDVLRNSGTRHTAEDCILRPLVPAVEMSHGAIFRERLRLQDNAWERLRYVWEVAHPTRTELVSSKGALRSRRRAWLLRAMHLAQLARRESVGHRPRAASRGISTIGHGTVP